MKLFHWLATHDGKLLVLAVGILACGFGLWQSILENRRTTERNYEALQRLERLIAERGK